MKFTGRLSRHGKVISQVSGDYTLIGDRKHPARCKGKLTLLDTVHSVRTGETLELSLDDGTASRVNLVKQCHDNPAPEVQMEFVGIGPLLA